MSRVLVTSWSPKGYEQYGRKFLESWKETGWDEAAPLVVFTEGHVPEIDGPCYVDLLGDQDLHSFLQRYGEIPAANGFGQTQDGRWVCDYRFQATKFARKVFAITSGEIPEADWRIWIDADVVFTKAPSEAFWEDTCPKEAAGSYIGRTDWHHSECGWVAYKTGDGHIRHFLERFRVWYTSGFVFQLPEWHDSYVFDQLRKLDDFTGPVWGLKWKNLAEGIGGMHPWPETVLGQYLIHNKGPVAKREFYGVG
jgi:hypothetical protein